MNEPEGSISQRVQEGNRKEEEIARRPGLTAGARVRLDGPLSLAHAEGVQQALPASPPLEALELGCADDAVGKEEHNPNVHQANQEARSLPKPLVQIEGKEAHQGSADRRPAQRADAADQDHQKQVDGRGEVGNARADIGRVECVQHASERGEGSGLAIAGCGMYDRDRVIEDPCKGGLKAWAAEDPSALPGWDELAADDQILERHGAWILQQIGPMGKAREWGMENLPHWERKGHSPPRRARGQSGRG